MLKTGFVFEARVLTSLFEVVWIRVNYKPDGGQKAGLDVIIVLK